MLKAMERNTGIRRISLEFGVWSSEFGVPSDLSVLSGDNSVKVK
jgi:hypothetical protein